MNDSRELVLPVSLTLQCLPRTSTATLNRQNVVIEAGKLISISPIDLCCEEETGVVAVGGMSVEVAFDPQNDRKLLEAFAGFEQGEERILCELIGGRGKEEVLFRGILQELASECTRGRLILRFSGGIALYDDDTSIELLDTETGEPWQGRPLRFLLDEVLGQSSNPPTKTQFTIPTLVSDQQFWSFAERPERRWADTSLPSDLSFRVQVLECDGGDVYVVVEDSLLAYQSQKQRWTLIGKLPISCPEGFDLVTLAMTKETGQLRLFCALQPQAQPGRLLENNRAVAHEVVMTL